ncbi:hypothetical protein D3C86_1802740 [compost metagenome]
MARALHQAPVGRPQVVREGQVLPQARVGDPAARRAVGERLAVGGFVREVISRLHVQGVRARDGGETLVPDEGA